MFLGRRFEATIEDILDFCDIFDDSLRFMFRFCHRKLTKSNILWFLKLVSWLPKTRFSFWSTRLHFCCRIQASTDDDGCPWIWTTDQNLSSDCHLINGFGHWTEIIILRWTSGWIFDDGPSTVHLMDRFGRRTIKNT